MRLPVPPTPLIGRESELAELGALLENPACRLVTIVGPGGIGKTRVALAAAAEQAEAFKHGAAFIPLAAISSAAFLAPAILSALDIALQGQRAPREQLLDELRDKELLLVLDNVEQLLTSDQSENDGIAELLSAILARAPGVTLLVPSRERLAQPGEWLFDVPGLSYPAGEPSDDFEGYNSVRLFMQRAGQVRRHFVLSEGEARAVARICQLVEGLPLAIELAAAVLRTRSCIAIADAIEASIMGLTTKLRAIPERQRSIWATFEHSWRLLSDQEHGVLRKLSVFRGGFEADAALQVAQASPELLSALVDKSLLRCDGAARYDIHELVRQYAGEKLEQVGETKQTRGRHLAHYLALAESAEPYFVHTDQVLWMDRLETKQSNLRAALRWALEQDDSVSALQLSGYMGKFWEVRGYWSEGRQWLEQALTLSLEVGSSTSSASAVPGWSALALRQAGRLAWRQSDFARARELLEQSLTLYRKVGDRLVLTDVLGLLGGLAFEQGEYATARARYEEGLALRRAVGDSAWISDSLFCIGLVSYHQGEYAAAQRLLEESLKLSQEAGYQLGTTYPLNALGNLANLQGDYAAAQKLYEECLALRRKLAYKRGIAATVADMANVQTKLAQYTTARSLYEESLTLYRELGNTRGMVSVLSGLACLVQIHGQPRTAARLLSAMEALLAQIHIRLEEPHHSDMEQAIATLHAQLGEETFAAAWAAGRALTLDEAVAEALRSNGHSGRQHSLDEYK
jgi:predicted ATPase